MERIDRIGPRHGGPEPLVPVARLERREPDPEERRRRERDRRRPAAVEPEQHPVEPGHVDVSA